jgi:hypothetical protein
VPFNLNIGGVHIYELCVKSKERYISFFNVNGTSNVAAVAALQTSRHAFPTTTSLPSESKKAKNADRC